MTTGKFEMASLYEGENPKPVDRAYNSENVTSLTQPELTAFLLANGLLGARLDRSEDVD